MQKPGYAVLRQLNESTFEYTANAGYIGTDTFSVQVTGKGPTASGTSVITLVADSIDPNADPIWSAFPTGKWTLVVSRRCRITLHLSGDMRALIAALLLAMAGPSLATEIVVTDGDTFQLDRTIYRLDGIDAPEIDQTCLDQRGDVWPCGVTARDRLSAYIGNRAVRCEDKGPDPVYKHRRIGICSIESEATTLNEWLVREGWAIKFEPYAKGRFAAEEADARVNRRARFT